MESTLTLATVLGKYVTRSGYKPNQLAQLSGIPKPTVVNWLTGRVKKPRQWQDLVALAGVLHLNESEVTELLQAAGHPSLAELLTLTSDETRNTLLAPWANAVQKQAPFQAIADLPYFVGREETLQAVKNGLLKGRHIMICSLQGMGGAGKTILAAHVAYQLRPFFPDGVLWARVDRANLMSILSTFAGAYGRDVSPYADLDSRSRVVRELLADKQALIILDDVQTSADVKPLLPPTSGSCAVMLTTRRQDLAITYGAHRFYLGPFNKEKQEALTLFAKILGVERVQKEQESFAEIAELLGHLPLAVAIVANRLAYEPGWRTSDFLARLYREEERLSELAGEDQSVRLSFNFSYEALSPEQQQLFAALGVFGGQDFGVTAVAYVTRQATEAAHDALRNLYRLSLVQPGQPGRYRLHPLLHDYARGQISNDQVWERMVDYFVSYAEAHEKEYEALDLESDNIQNALQIAFERGMPAALVQATNKLYPFWEVRGLYELAEVHLRRAGQAARASGDDDGLAMALFHLGRTTQQLGDHEQAEAYLEEGLALVHESSHVKAVGHRFLGWALWQQGKYEAARLHLEQALTLARNVPLPQVEADSLNNLGTIYWYLGDYAIAKGYYEQSLHLYRQLGDRRNEGAVLLNLGNIPLNQSDYAESKHYLEQALHISRQVGYQLGESRALNTLGNLFYYQGRYVQAEVYYEQALHIWQVIKYRRGEGIGLHNLGMVFFEQGHYMRAKACYEQALLVGRETGGRQAEGRELYHLAIVYHCLGDYATGNTLYEQALTIFQDIGFQDGKGQVMADWGLLFHHQGDNKYAQEYAQQALLIAQELGDLHAQSIALTFLGHALIGLEYLTEAAAAYQQALALRQELEQPHLAMEPLAGLASVYLFREELNQALAYVEEILTYLETGSLDGTKEPFRVYLTCYYVLCANEDFRSQVILTNAHHLLQERVARIGDQKLQRYFIENVVTHKKIISEFANQDKQKVL